MVGDKYGDLSMVIYLLFYQIIGDWHNKSWKRWDTLGLMNGCSDGIWDDPWLENTSCVLSAPAPVTFFFVWWIYTKYRSSDFRSIPPHTLYMCKDVFMAHIQEAAKRMASWFVPRHDFFSHSGHIYSWMGETRTQLRWPSCDAWMQQFLKSYCIKTHVTVTRQKKTSQIVSQSPCLTDICLWSPRTIYH